MADTKPKNPRAFPRGHETGSLGMSLRDYFAAKAMEGDMQGNNCSSANELTDMFGARADAYYRIADEMLRARGQEE